MGSTDDATAQAAHEYRIKDNVAVWDLREFLSDSGATKAENEQLRADFMEVTSRSSITASVTVYADDTNINTDTLEAIGRYNELFEQNDIERSAVVASDIKGMAVKSRIDKTAVEFETFESEDAAVEWAAAATAD